MTTLTFSINIRDAQHNIQSSDIEFAFPRSTLINKEGAVVNVPELLCNPLHQRVDALKTVLNKIDELENHKCCEYAKAAAKSLFYSALFATCVVSVILLIVVSNPEIAVACAIIALLSFLACSFLTVLYSSDFKDKIESVEKADPNYTSPWYFTQVDMPGAILDWICIPFFTISSIYEICTRKKRLERVRDTLQNAIQTTLTAHVEDTIDYFQNRKEQRYQAYLAEQLAGCQNVRAAYQAFEHNHPHLAIVQQHTQVLEGNQRDLQKLSQLYTRLTSA